jgi:hypothetical protein
MEYPSWDALFVVKVPTAIAPARRSSRRPRRRDGRMPSKLLKEKRRRELAMDRLPQPMFSFCSLS